MKIRTTFAAAALAVATIAGTATTAMAGTAGDLGDGNGDGKADLWTTTRDGHYQQNTTYNGKTQYWETGLNGLGYPKNAATYSLGLGTANAMIAVPDLNGDKKADMMVRFGTHLYVYYGNGKGSLTRQFEVGHGWGAMDTLVYAGNLNGDSTRYLLGRSATDHNLYAYKLGSGGQVGTVGMVGKNWGAMKWILAPGQMVGDAKADMVGIDTKGYMHCYAGYGLGKVTSTGVCGHGWANFRTVFVIGDRDGKGRWDIAGVKYPTNHYANGEPIIAPGKTLSDYAAKDRGAMYLYQNLGNAVWGPAYLIGHDMFMYDLFA